MRHSIHSSVHPRLFTIFDIPRIPRLHSSAVMTMLRCDQRPVVYITPITMALSAQRKYIIVVCVYFSDNGLGGGVLCK